MKQVVPATLPVIPGLTYKSDSMSTNTPGFSKTDAFNIHLSRNEMKLMKINNPDQKFNLIRS